jgi:hypothetical protein
MTEHTGGVDYSKLASVLCLKQSVCDTLLKWFPTVCKVTYRQDRLTMAFEKKHIKKTLVIYGSAKA